MNAEVVDILKTIQKVATTPSMAGYDFAAALKEIGHMAERGVQLSHREVIPQERLGHVELADPEDMAIELEEVRAASRAGIEAAFDAGCEDGAFSADRWPEGKMRSAYVDGWNRCNPDDLRR